jgi:hypothetical protein
MNALYRSLRHVFRPVRTDDEGQVVPLVWIGDEHDVVCINPNTIRVYATMWNDGMDTKYYPTIYVSIVAAVRLLFEEHFATVGLRCFPQVGLELTRDKCHSMGEARERLEYDMRAFGVL